MIFTFYSYKGGVGRSMALVNIAEFFAQAGLRVLMIDWDLEAPGLERFFLQNKSKEEIEKALSRRGVIDLLVDYKLLMSQPIELTPEGELPLEQIDEDLLLELPVEGSGKLQLLTAGRRPSGKFSAYAERVITFDWMDFYRNWKGEFYFEWLRTQLHKVADVILIDSRTGVTEMSGVCTYHLADTVIMLCGASIQSMDGTERMLRNFKSDIVRKARNQRPLEVIVVPARVEQNGKDEDEKQFREEIQEKFEQLPDGLKHYFSSVWDFRIKYIPAYGFKEIVSMRDREMGFAEEVNPSYIHIAKAMAIVSGSETLQFVFPELRNQQSRGINLEMLRLDEFVSKENLTEAQRVLSNAEYRYPENSFLQVMRRKVEGLQQKLSELEQVKSYQQYVDEPVNVSLGDLRQFASEINTAIAKYPDHRELAPVLQQIRTRADYLEGLQAYEEGQYFRAKELLLVVNNDTARDLIKRLDEAQAKEIELNQIVRRVHEARKERQWPIAYDLLSPWNNILLVPHLHVRVRRELDDLTQEWEVAVIEQLNRLLRETSPEISTIRGYLDILKKIGSAQLNEWERKALGPYYEKIAKKRQRNGVYEGEGGCLIAWEQATRVDPDNEVYRNGRSRAEKEFAEIRIIANPKDYALMVQLYSELIEKNGHELDNHIKLADAYLRQKEFDKAENALHGAESVLRGNADVPGHALVSLQEVKERWSREKEIARHQNSLLDKLRSERKGYEYREAWKEFQGLLAEYPNENSNLKLWWEETVDELARQLEDKTNEARRQKANLWIAAEPLLKLLLLQPEHAGMRRLLNEVNDDLVTLIQAIGQIVTEERKKEDYLGEEGFAEVHNLYEKSQGYIALLRPYADKLLEWQTQLLTLEAQDARLAIFLQQLQSFRTKLEQGEQAIEQAKLSGEWGKAEQIGRDLQQRDVREALPVMKFMRQLEQAKADRTLFLTRLKTFEQAVQENNFVEAHRLGQQIGQYYDDNKNVNPDTKEYRTKLHPLSVRFSQLQQLLQDYAYEAETYYDWLRPVLLIAPWNSANITVQLPKQNDLGSLNDLVNKWLETIPSSETLGGGGNQIFHLVQQLVKKGSFTEALALCADVIGENKEHMEIQPFAGRYTLEFLRHRLSNQPVRGEWLVHELPIDKAERLSKTCLEQINLWIQEVLAEQQRISELSKEFEQIRGEIKQRLRYFDLNLRFRRGKSVRDTLILCDQLSEISPENKEIERFRSILRVF
jgi:MinD-like ATPase involved in chromosome partitioning or flagellar assembly